ncbi:hypothetical protein [Oxalicibacterium solurbis]|uniref:hypothetical protein n=1 Tax=Oxalicibacterium solurbis TaxID=69280 RepID=UPI00166B5051|nr:hypothetical protein [Oxalicibacterium solurbis]
MKLGPEHDALHVFSVYLKTASTPNRRRHINHVFPSRHFHELPADPVAHALPTYTRGEENSIPISDRRPLPDCLDLILSALSGREESQTARIRPNARQAKFAILPFFFLITNYLPQLFAKNFPTLSF